MSQPSQLDQHDPGPEPESNLGLPGTTQGTGEQLVDLPGWLRPPETPGQSHPDAIPDGETDQAGAGQDASAKPASTSTTGSTSAGALSKKALGEACAQIFRGVGEMLNHTTRQHPEDDIWLPGDDEAKQVGNPAGRIIARRIPDLPDSEATDVADLISMGIPLAIYAVRNLAKWLPRARRPKQPKGIVVAPATEGPQQQ